MGSSEKFLPPDRGKSGIMLAQGPEGEVEGPHIYDSSHSLSAYYVSRAGLSTLHLQFHLFSY